MPPVLWVLVPILGAAIVHGPVLRFDLLRDLKRPLDGGATLRGRRIFGDNKTWRGAFSIVAGIMLAAVLLSWWPAYWTLLPLEVQRADPRVFGLLLGIGFVVGELPNSFLKRQLDIAPGSQRRTLSGVLISLYDQGDFVLGMWLTLAPIWVMTPLEALLAFVVAVGGHLIVNVLGYWIGARKNML